MIDPAGENKSPSNYLYQLSKNSSSFPELHVTTPLGKVMVIKSQQELNKFINEQDVYLKSLKETSSQYKQIEEGNRSLKRIQNIFSHILPPIAKTSPQQSELQPSPETAQLISFNKKITQYGSPHMKTLSLQHGLDPDNIEQIPAHKFELLSRVATVIAKLEKSDSVAKLHEIADNFQLPVTLPTKADENIRRDEAELRAGLNTFIQFIVGFRTIDLQFTAPEFSDQKEVLKEFYKDQTHPMDLQKFIRHPSMSVGVCNVLKNLTIAINNNKLGSAQMLVEADSGAFNQFLIQLITTRPMSPTPTLLDIATIPADIEKIRSSQYSYYTNLGLTPEFVDEHLSFSTSEEERGIHLYANDPAFMVGQSRMIDQDKGLVYLRVPDAGNRVVRISLQGFEALKSIQAQSAVDLMQIARRMETILADPKKVVTGRTKSDFSILDKTGRICAMTQKAHLDKYRNTQDIIDINGLRITCQNSSELGEVIQKLQANGFEFLELDNKYNTIRKDGSYKVIPNTIRDSLTGNVFELQLTTVSSLATSDLSHNVIYKKDAIALNVSDRQRNWVQAAARMCAIVETINLIAAPVDLMQPLPDEEDKLKAKL